MLRLLRLPDYQLALLTKGITMTRLISVFFLLLLLGVMPLAVHAQKLDYINLSLPELTRMAEAGDANAQFDLGSRYSLGQGVPQDYRQAFNWYRKAAEQGHDGAQNNLGSMYDRGNGVPQSLQQAIYWWRKAAAQGSPPSQYLLGTAYANGRGVPQNYRQAVSWYQKAAEQGFSPAQLNLGNMYANGEGVHKDIVLAYALLGLAAANGHNDAARSRDIIAKDMTRPQIAEGDAIASRWRPGQPFPTSSRTGRSR
ncbi:MAG: sel1 repeat family protein [Betaproteobacteria bacterium]|nr:sel1 repeat family protein [Betaproteobacteria bacterium]